MSGFKEIKTAITALSEDKYIELRQWFLEKDWQKWDEQIKKDVDSGELDFLIKEAFDIKKYGSDKNSDAPYYRPFLEMF
jgi:hypothetical protein